MYVGLGDGRCERSEEWNVWVRVKLKAPSVWGTEIRWACRSRAGLYVYIEVALRGKSMFVRGWSV